MADEPQTYVWELGIEWNAVVGSFGMLGASYMPGGFAGPIGALEIQRPVVRHNDQIVFRIFDLIPPTATRRVAEIESFTLNSVAATDGQHPTSPFSILQPALGSSTTPATGVPSQYFGGSPPCFEAGAVLIHDPTAVWPPDRFELTFVVQAKGIDGTHRAFAHDPEMLVGPNM